MKTTATTRTARTSKRVALARVAALLARLDVAATMAERAELTAQIWTVREIAGLPH